MTDYPASVRIAGQTWDLHFVDGLITEDEGWCYGRIDTRQLTIYVNTQAAFQQQQDTLLHEILHAVISNCPVFHDSTTEESLIRSVTPYLLTVLKDNPGVVEFMTSEDEPSE